MALFEDLANILNISQSLTRPSSTPTATATGQTQPQTTSDGMGLPSLLGRAARDSAQSERRSLDFISGLPPIAKSILQDEAIQQGYSTIEEAMRFAPGIMQSRATELAKYYLTPTEEPTRFRPPMGSDTITITELPPLPTEADILAADMEQGGMMMAEPNPRSLAFAENLYPKTLSNEEARLRGMADFLAKEGGAYGGRGALDAASGIDTGFTERVLSGGRGAAASDFEQEKAALEIGALVIPGKIGIEAAMIAARNAGPRALLLVQRLLREKGLLGPSNMVRQSREFGSTGAARQTLARRGTEYDPKMAGPGDSMAMARGGNIRQAMIDRYNRMS